MLEISGQALSLADIASVALSERTISLSERARGRMQASREVIEQVLREGRVVYGVNTGFGKLCDVRIPASELETLQLNLVRSHACGLGEPLSEAETRAMMLLRANVLARGNSGCRVEVVETLLRMLEQRVHAVIPEKGSVGASGDLAPLAHLALSMIGEGQARFGQQTLPSMEALRQAEIAPLRLAAKEGLALLNGTQAMAGVGALALWRGLRIAALADLAGAMSLEALRGTPVAFDPRIQELRPHPGQIVAAGHLRDLLEGSEIRQSHVTNDPRVQDAYSLRCMPQVHGAVRTAIQHAREVTEIETGSATDNPLVFADSGQVLSGGNFHGAPLGMVYDYAAIALTDLISMSERRIERLVNPDLNEGLPPFLSSHPGTSSGYMIAQICAASLLNEAKVLAHPASSDNVPTSGGKEDHVSMGMTSALKLRQIVSNAESVVSIELLAATEGLDYRAPLRSSKRIERARELIRSLSARLIADRPLSPDIERVAQAVGHGDFDEFVS
ncbi:MAG: histidine ammonia-lyase [Acidobacteriaceae bacterium]|nr:histidine ammonia-lyase [Acidobacteriaceae bacterium]MBV9781059.1 histidine ammonia-lyase [Acidobacteriaceae bacterium]